ncbi:hypothetical protein OHA98_41145 [Streptomyces sp. NBC_00654]|uniref:hypothetical protein n=1 Tax=Streptomyces sp. NBC_00654 TaxID=2975799 RepID=UPI00224DA169|nr:hypothetical protein [Streptomyces sp. NBC_00654]MCX4971023.1 hypothetical protein [Streptomyces sp. NBC_00654]
MAAPTLLQRYLRAGDLWTAHVMACPVCRTWIRARTGTACTGGAPHYQALATAQDEYLNHLNTR